MRASEMLKLSRGEANPLAIDHWFDQIIAQAKDTAEQRGETSITFPNQPGKAFSAAVARLRALGYSVSKSPGGGDNVVISWAEAT